MYEVKKELRALFFVLIFIILVGCTQSNNQNENILDNKKMNSDKSYKDITSEELKNMLDSGEEISLIDVHIPEQKHIKGTDALIPFNEIEQNLDKLPKDKNEKIVVYCRSGSMSKTASETLVRLGYTNVFNQLGGVKDWEQKGYEFE